MLEKNKNRRLLSGGNDGSAASNQDPILMKNSQDSQNELENQNVYKGDSYYDIIQNDDGSHPGCFEEDLDCRQKSGHSKSFLVAVAGITLAVIIVGALTFFLCLKWR